MNNIDLTRLRLDDIYQMKSSKPGEFIYNDWYRMVAAVEETNAEFEGFIVRDLPGRPTNLIGYPVRYTDEVQEGEIFGGMWSEVREGELKHPSAFVRMVSNWD